jgi:glycosyltransferase involved in cell wall biosynthesis
MNKKNFLLISQVFYPEQFPINLLAESLKKKGYNISVLTGYPTYPKFYKYFRFFKIYPSVSYFKKIKIFRIPIFPRINNSPVILIMNYMSFIINSILIAPFFLFRKKVDYIFIYATSPLLQALIGVFVKKVKKSKLIVWVQDLWPESLEYTGYVKNKFILYIIKKIVKFIFDHSDLILVQSNSFKKNIQKITNKKIDILYNPSKNLFFKKKLHYNKKIKYLYAGNIGSVQSVETIVEIAKKFKKNKYINFEIIGDGSRVGRIKDLIKKYKLKNIIVKSSKSYNQIKKEIYNADILIVTLKKHGLSEKTIPSKIQAYMSSGKPILCTIEGESAKLIKQANCGFVCKNNPKSLNKTIKRINTTKKSKLKKLGENGKKYFLKNFTVDKVTYDLKKILNNLNE